MHPKITKKKQHVTTARTAYSNNVETEEELLLDLTMNLDPFTISEIKKEFDSKSGAVNLEEFVLSLRSHFKE